MTDRSRGRRRWHRKALPVLLLLSLCGGTVIGLRYFLTRSPGREFRERSKAAGIAMSAERYAEARLILVPLVEEYPDRLRLRQSLTICLLKLGRPADAAAVARGTIEIDPEYAPAHALLSLAYRAQGGFEGAIREARLATTGRAVAENARAMLADVLIGAGLESEGIRILVEQLELDQTSQGVALRLATLMAGREIESGIASRKVRSGLMQRLGELEEQLEGSPADPDLVGAVARLALAADEPRIATSALISAKVHRELSAGETLLLARALAASGHTDRARALVDGLSPVTPDPVPVAQLPPEERQAAAEALRAFESRVMARIETGDADKAIEALDRLSPEVAGTLPLLRLRLVALWRVFGRESAPLSTLDLGDRGEDLEATATAILEMRPLDEKARASRALALLTTGHPDAALADALFLRRHSPGLDDGPWLHGLATLQLGFARSALDLFAEARPGAVDPDSARWIMKAAVLARDVETLARLAPLVREAGNGALLTMAALIAGDADRAERLASGESFASSPLTERVQAARMLCAAGRDGAAKSLLRVLSSESVREVGIYRAGLLLRLGRDQEAVAVLHEVADDGGPHAVTALLGLSKRAAEREDDDEIQALLGRVRAHPESGPRALLHEGKVALSRGDHEQALEKAELLLDLQPLSASARALKLEALLAAGAAPEKIDPAVDAVLEVAPGFGSARIIRALAFVSRARMELRAGNPGLATDQLDQVVGMAPDAVGVRMLRGLALLGEGDLSGAEKDVELLKNSEGYAFAGQFLDGLLRSRRGEFEAAVECFEAAIEIEPDSADAVSALGWSLLRAGRLDQAVLQADRLATLRGGTVPSLKIRAWALVAKHELAQAERALREAVQADETDLGARLLLSRVLAASERKAEAVVVLRGAILVRPEAAAAHGQLVLLLAAEGDLPGAIQAADAAGEIEGLEAVSHLLRFHCLQLSGRKKESLEELRSALRFEPDQPFALQYLGEMAVADGDLAGGRRLLARAADAAPKNQRLLLRLGALAQAAGEDADAKAWYERLLVMNPDDHLAANNLAYLLAAEPGTTERAVSLARQAALSDPANAEYHDTLAVALSAHGRHEDAIASSQEAMRLLPKNARIVVRSAMIHRDAGRTEKARSLAATALELANPSERDEVEREVKKLLATLPED